MSTLEERIRPFDAETFTRQLDRFLENIAGIERWEPCDVVGCPMLGNAEWRRWGYRLEAIATLCPEHERQVDAQLVQLNAPEIRWREVPR